jgi:hypothetical protein
MSELGFEEQRKAYQIHGYAMDPSSQSVHNTQYIFNKQRLSELASYKPGDKRKRLPQGDPSDNSFLGPWAKYEDELIEALPPPSLVI